MITRKTIDYNIAPLSLVWEGNELKDWVGNGRTFSLDGSVSGVSSGKIYKFDAAIQSDDGIYVVVYEKLGTKGVLLKNGDVLREINRSYYFADVTEYPIAFININGKCAIVHCPDEYYKIEIDDADTGTRLTDTLNREEPVDCFQSRFRVNPSHTKLLTSGWVWHPMDIVELIDIEAALSDNSLLDNPQSDTALDTPEVCSAEFLSDDLIVMSLFQDLKEPIHELGLFSIEKGAFIKKVEVGFQLGTLIPFNEDYVIDLYEHPKLIDLNSGEVKQRFEAIDSGNQTSSRIYHEIPPIAVDYEKQRIAIGNGKKIELLEMNIPVKKE